jgi:hypothetical protein
MDLTKRITKGYLRILIIILCVSLIINLYYFYTKWPYLYINFRTLFQRKIYTSELNKTIANKVFKTSNKYCDVIYKVSEDGETLYVTIHYKDVSDVGTIHIHAVMWGHEKYISDLGPVIGWLGTSEVWQHGVHQLTPGLNSPCCLRGKGLGCDYVAPPGTPDLKDLSFTTRNFVIKKNFCSDECPWIYNGSSIVVHGKQEQHIFNGCLTTEKAWADPIGDSMFNMILSEKFEEVK